MREFFATAPRPLRDRPRRDSSAGPNDVDQHGDGAGDSVPLVWTEGEALLIAGAALVDVVAKWDRWVYRRVDSVHPLVDERGRRKHSLDCVPPPDPALAIQPEERFVDTPQEVLGQVMVPLAYVAKGPLREFDARQSDDLPMPVLGTPDTWRYGVAMVESELRRSNLSVDLQVLEIVREIVGPSIGPDDDSEVDEFIRTGAWRLCPPADPSIFDGNDAGELLRTLADRFLLVGLIEASSAGTRQVLKFSYDWHVEGAPRKDFWHSLRVAAGFSTRRIDVPLEAPSAAASYHLEFQTPPEARCRLLRLPGNSADVNSLGSFDDSRRPVSHVHASYAIPPDQAGELVVDLPFRGLRTTTFLAAVFTAVLMLLAILLPDAKTVWRTAPEGPATVLLVVPAVVLTLLAARGESALIREAMTILRASLFSSALGLFLVAASIVGGLVDPWLDWLWWAVAIWACVLAVGLGIGAVISERVPKNQPNRGPDVRASS